MARPGKFIEWARIPDRLHLRGDEGGSIFRSNADRKRAIVEGFRVLKPRGRMVVADIRATALYEETLRGLGASKAPG